MFSVAEIKLVGKSSIEIFYVIRKPESQPPQLPATTNLLCILFIYLSPFLRLEIFEVDFVAFLVLYIIG